MDPSFTSREPVPRPRLRRFPPARALQLLALAAFAALLASPAPVRAASGDLIASFPFPGIAAQGIARDGTDGTYWVTSLLDGVIRRFDGAGNLLSTIPSPFGSAGRPTGIAWYPLNDTLLVVNSLGSRLLEIDKTGVPAGIDTILPVGAVLNPGGPVIRGIAVHPAGGSGEGSLYAVETVGAQIYEFDLLGASGGGGVIQIRSFDHPQDPDGYPGSGAGADAGGIALVLDLQGQLAGIDLVGADPQGAPEVLRLAPDGSPTGYTIPLLSTGSGTGSVGGLVRAIIPHPVSGLPVDALIGTSESIGQVFTVDGSLPPIAEITGLACDDAGTTISLSWTPGPGYDSVLVERDGSLLATLPGSAASYVDAGLADGVHRYSVHGVAGPLSTSALECVGVIGAGQVLAETVITGFQFALDLAWGNGVIYVSTNEGTILVYFDDLSLAGSIPMPFQGPDDDPSGIAYRPETGTLLVLNAFDNRMQEIDLAGNLIGPPVLLDIPVPDDDPTWAGAIAYDPAGDGGQGAVWAVESNRAIVHRLGRDGELLGSFTHPDELFEPTPDPSFLDTFAHGITGSPGGPGPFTAVDLPGGTVHERRMTRILRVDAATGAPIGVQIPLDGMNAVQPVRYYAIEHGLYLGAPATFALGLRANETRLYAVVRTPPPVAPLDFLRCEQPDLVDRAEITFTNHGPYDSIAVERNGLPLAVLPGAATSYIDDTATPGRHRYRLIPSLGGVPAEPRECELRLGIGARLARSFLDPAFSPYQMARDPTDGSFVVTSNSAIAAVSLYRFDAGGTFLGTIPAPEAPPWLVAALAIRPTPAGSQIWSITWEVRAPWLQTQVFHLTVQDMAGMVISGPTTISIPGAPVGVSLTYPASMVHDPESDTFWFLERNMDIYWQMGLTGQLLASFPHPEPPLQQFVFNLGLALDAERDEFTATTAGPFDTQITKAIGMSRDGGLTGTTIPLDEADMNPLNTLARSGAHIFVAGSFGSIPYLVTLKAADGVASPTGLDCAETQANAVTLAWSSPVSYDEVAVRRDGIVIALLPGAQTSYIDVGVGNGPRVYTVSGRTIAGESAPTVCSLVVAGLDPQFVRGDGNQDGTVNVADPIASLSWLFSGGPEPACPDAADANDSGALDIADAVYTLAYLFSGGLPPAPPFPAPGADPTGDGLGCS